MVDYYSALSEENNQDNCYIPWKRINIFYLLPNKKVKMLATYLKKYRSMILCSIFFFYLGCGVTLSLLKMDCAEVTKVLGNSINQESDAHTKVEYAVVILSGKDNQIARDIIRSTWKRLANNIIVENGERLYRWNTSAHKTFIIEPIIPPNFIRFYFVIGTKSLSQNDTNKLMSELEISKDLLLLPDVEEGYTGLTRKMLSTMEWFSSNLKNLKYLIKCDDDSFVRIDMIVKNLEAFGPSMQALEIADYVTYKYDIPSNRGLYWGYFNGRAHVYQTGKWMEREWFICDNYLPYALGGGYVISKAIVKYVGSNSNLLNPYKSEDVSMGVWTAALHGINRVHDIRFDTEWKSRGCSNNMLIRHKQNHTDMKQMYLNLKHSNGIKLCSNISEVRKSYLYKWDVLPSGCCK